MNCANTVLTKWYLGELGGHALFLSLAVADAQFAFKWTALARIEERVAVQLRQVLIDRSIAVPRNDSLQEHARERCSVIVDKSWADKMRWLFDITDAALVQIRDEADSLPHELAETGALVVRHEVALRSFAERESRGEVLNSLQPVYEFLAASRVGN